MNKELDMFLQVDLKESDMDDFDEIQSLMLKHGLEMRIIPNKDGTARIRMTVNRIQLNRKSGRRTKVAKTNDDKNTHIYYSDILEMQKTMTDNEIVSKLNMSRATFYRRLKKAKENSRIGMNPLF